jgi:iron(III) transport system substrate-binding protein
MKKMLIGLSGLIVLTILWAGIGMTADRPAPPRFGQSYDEIVAMAKKEGKARLTTALLKENADFQKTFGRKFKERFGIDIEYEFIQGQESRERILLEILAGRINYDLVQIIPEVVTNYNKAGVIDGPFDWSLFGVDPVYVSPDKRMITAGSTVYCFAYNPDLVPKERIPRKWEDLLDPYYKGKFVVVTRPQAFVGLYPHWGKQKTLDYCKALAANNPVWLSSFAPAFAGIRSGEYPILVGANTTDVLQLEERDPSGKIKMQIPTEVPVDAYFHTVIVKNCAYPNAGLLLAGWLASPEGQKMFDTVARRGSPMVAGTEISRLLKEAGSKVLFNGWEVTAEIAQQRAKEVLEVWGFPKPK